VPLGWYDTFGYNCNWYAEGSNCEELGSSNSNFGKTANQACEYQYPHECDRKAVKPHDRVTDVPYHWSRFRTRQLLTIFPDTALHILSFSGCACGGGSNLDEEDTILNEPLPEGNGDCYDSPNWIDSVGDSCTWYAQGFNCQYYATQFAGEDGTAAQNCCACGGGSATPPPPDEFEATPGCSSKSFLAGFYPLDSPCSHTFSCQLQLTKDLPSAWVNADGDTCAFYAEGNNCELYGNLDPGVDGKTANEACCVCGGTSTAHLLRTNDSLWNI